MNMYFYCSDKLTIHEEMLIQTVREIICKSPRYLTPFSRTMNIYNMSPEDKLYKNEIAIFPFERLLYRHEINQALGNQQLYILRSLFSIIYGSGGCGVELM